MSRREGSDVDEQKLKEIFGFLRFSVRVERDKTAAELFGIFDKIRFLKSLESHDAFVCVILSHGGSGDLIFGVDGRSVSVHDITKKFNDENCFALRGKPKMFFVNACRGGK